LKLYAQIINEHETALSWDNIQDTFDEEGKKLDYQSPYHTKDDSWYEIEREPNKKEREYLEYNSELDVIEIKQREKTSEELTKKIEDEKHRQLSEQYSINEIIDLQDMAIRALADGETQLPEEYLTYKLFKESIK